MYNSFLRTKGLFERLCHDLNVPEGERSFRKRLAAVAGVNELSPWITIARDVWKKLTDEQQAAVYAAGEAGALAVLVDTEQYKTYVTDHALGDGGDDPEDETPEETGTKSGGERSGSSS